MLSNATVKPTTALAAAADLQNALKASTSLLVLPKLKKLNN